IAEKRPLLKLAGLRHGDQTGQGDFTLGAAVAIRDLANEHEQAHSSLGDIVGGLHTLVFEEREQLVPVLVDGARKIAHLAILTIQEHNCPAITRTESIVWRNRVNCFGTRVAEVPVKWAFSHKASDRKSVV